MFRLNKAAEEFADTELAEVKSSIWNLYDSGLLNPHDTLVAVKAIDFMYISKKHYRVLRQIKISAASMIAGMVTSYLLRLF